MLSHSVSASESSDVIIFWQYHSPLHLSPLHRENSSMGFLFLSAALDSVWTALSHLCPSSLKGWLQKWGISPFMAVLPPTSFLHSLSFLTSLVFCHFFPSPWVGETLFSEFPWFYLVLYQTGQTATGPPPWNPPFSSLLLFYSRSLFILSILILLHLMAPTSPEFSFLSLPPTLPSLTPLHTPPFSTSPDHPSWICLS